MIAIQWGNSGVVRTLLDHGATIDTHTIAEAVVAKQTDNAILDTVLDYIGDTRLSEFKNSCSLLSLAAREHSCEKVRRLLKHGASVTFDSFGYPTPYDNQGIITLKNYMIPPLAACIHFGCKPCFELIFQATSPSMDINYKDQLKLPPLLYALLDSQWTCYKRFVSTKPNHLHSQHKCTMQYTTMKRFSSFPLSIQRLDWAEDFMHRGADVKSVFRYGIWWDCVQNSKIINLPLHLLCRAHHNISSDCKYDDPTLKLKNRFADDYHGLFLLHLDGFTLTASNIHPFSNQHSTRSVDLQSKISEFWQYVMSNPKTLQNIAVISIRNSLMAGSHGSNGNILYAADQLDVPTALYDRITLKTFDGLARKEIQDLVAEIQQQI